MFQIDKVGFNPENPTTMHIDINSCFATVEQQFDMSLRNKPIAVVARNHIRGCILAPSIEAKRFGVKTGMAFWEAQKLVPGLIPIEADPPKYRYIHKKMREVLDRYTNHLSPKSIDEFVLHLKNFPAEKIGITKTALEIKERIKNEVGDWIRVSIGIGPNRFLAKTAAGIKKPDGLEEINLQNHIDVFSKLQLQDLCGISRGNGLRLNEQRIFSVMDFYNADYWKLKSAFKSVNAYYWYMRLHGWEIDDFETKRGSFSHSCVVGIPITDENELMRVLQKLVEKLGAKIRKSDYYARSIYAGVRYHAGGSPAESLKGSLKEGYWGEHHQTPNILFDSTEIFSEAYKIIKARPFHDKAIKQIVVGCFNLVPNDHVQLNFFNDVVKQKNFSTAIDTINSKWGDFTVKPARLMKFNDVAPDSIAFGK